MPLGVDWRTQILMRNRARITAALVDLVENRHSPRGAAPQAGRGVAAGAVDAYLRHDGRQRLAAASARALIGGRGTWRATPAAARSQRRCPEVLALAPPASYPDQDRVLVGRVIGGVLRNHAVRSQHVHRTTARLAHGSAPSAEPCHDGGIRLIPPFIRVLLRIDGSEQKRPIDDAAIFLRSGLQGVVGVMVDDVNRVPQVDKVCSSSLIDRFDRQGRTHVSSKWGRAKPVLRQRDPDRPQVRDVLLLNPPGATHPAAGIRHGQGP